METERKQKMTGRKALAFGGLVGAGVALWVLAGGFVSPDARGSQKSEHSAAVQARAASGSQNSIEPGWASCEKDVCDIQLD